MKRVKTLAVVMVTVLPFLAWAADKTGTAPLELKTFQEKISYVMGKEIGQSINESPTEIDVNALTRGLQDAMNKRPSLISAEEEESVKAEFSTKMQEEQSKKMAALAEENSKAEAAFLAKNKSVKGVVTTASGLQYQVLKEGNGPTPSETDRVKVNYLGKLLDGKEFDSSYTRKEPAVFAVNGVIPGWTEGLQLMKMGGNYRLWVPSKLAYGARGAGRMIGPNAMLIFDVEPIEIVKE
jgi:FKBP-type peptidyl-prolyl cis-trans isomerase